MTTTTLRIAASLMVVIGVLLLAAIKNHHYITAASVPEPAWKAEFRRAYALREGEVLKRVAPPFPACRASYCKFLKAEYFHHMDLDNVTMSYRFDGKNVSFWSLAPGSNSVGLLNLLGNLGIPVQDIEIDKDWRDKQIRGEFVMRTGASVEKVAPRLEHILRQELNLPLRLRLRKVEREVIVVGGKYESKPRANRMRNEVDLFAIEPDDNGGVPGGSGTLDEFLVAVGSHIDRRLVNDLANTPKGKIRWYYHNRLPSAPKPDAEGVLKNITRQTGLIFKREKRKVQVLFVKSE